jgi:predicted permease
MKSEANIGQGMEPEEARREARREFGNLTRLGEMSREVWSLNFVELLVHDLRFAWRLILKQPGFTLIAVVSLAFGIGANTAIFSIFNTAILRPLPVASPDRVVALNSVEAKHRFPTFSYPNYRDLRDRNQVFSGLIGYSYSPLNLSHGGMKERLWGYLVTGNYFEVLGVKAALGRTISVEDDRVADARPVAVLSYQCWQRRFGGAPGIVGQHVIVNNNSYTVIGVAQPGFYGTEIITAPDLFFPMAMQPQLNAGRNWMDDRAVSNLFVVGRLKPGITWKQAQAAVGAMASQLEREYPEVNKGRRVELGTPGLMGGMMRGSVLGFTGLLMLIVGLVLLLACVNLANLLLARAAERSREIALRLALGAGRFRLIRQLLTESLLLSLVGGGLGLLMAVWLVRLANSFKPPISVPLAVNLQIDYRVFIFTGAISVLAGVMFGLIPALQATRTDLISALKDEGSFGGYRRSWLKSSLIVLQVALSLLLLIGGGLMLRGLQRAETIDLGFDPRGAVEASFDLRLQGYGEAPGREFLKRLLERVRALPGVQAAGLADLVPVDLHFSSAPLFIEGQSPARAESAPRALISLTSPGYFEAMSIRLVRGRDFTESEDEQAPRVAIVNETFARSFWPGEDPLGKRFSMWSRDSQQWQVIGVAQDGKYAGLSESPKPFVYRPIFQSNLVATSLIVRSGSDSPQLVPTIYRELQQLDPHLPISPPQTLKARLSLPLFPARVAASVLGGFGLLALMLAAIGIYGVMSYAVSRRTREIGIRMALGAQPSAVLRLVMGQGMVLLLVGIVIGLGAAVAMTSLMKSLLFGVSATDPPTFAVITALLASVAMLAFYLPARRALRVDPVVALRYE